MSSPWTSVTATHLSRKAALYIRQSTLHQVQVHIGSTAVQMNQMEFIERLGWPKDRVWILDGDMGITGTSAEARDDWQLLHQAIARSEVGLVAFSATSRASRTHRDFAVLVGLCQLYDVLVLVDGSLVDPKIPSQRLLLGIRSVFDEYENDERIQRLRGVEESACQEGLRDVAPARRLRESRQANSAVGEGSGPCRATDHHRGLHTLRAPALPAPRRRAPA